MNEKDVANAINTQINRLQDRKLIKYPRTGYLNI